MTALALVASTLVLAGSAAAAPCLPTARVRGEPSLVLAIEPILRERGIVVLSGTSTTSSFASSCPVTGAEVASGGARVMVWIDDAQGRRVERLTDDVEGAATVIESWARHDIVDPLLAMRSVAERETSATTAPPSPVSTPGPRFMIAASADAGLSRDGGVWSGPRIFGCALLGHACFGVAARYAIDLAVAGDAVALGTTRTSTELTLFGEYQLRRNVFVLAPNVGIGMSSVTARLEAESEVEQASAVHARAGFATGVRVNGPWAIRVDVALDVAPLARERLGDADGIDRQLAASSKLHAWLGVALAYGGL